jgi:hypothetical protein
MLWFICAFCLSFSLAGLLVWLSAMRMVRKSRAIADWPTVEARLTGCELQAKDESSSQVLVSYRYQVQGREYDGDKIHPEYFPSGGDCHQALYDRLHGAEIVEAHYNESNPSEAYLVAGSYNMPWMLFFAGLFFVSIGVLSTVFFDFYSFGNSNYVEGLHVLQ